MNRPKAIIEANNEFEHYEMYSVEPLCDHDGDGARQHIATIYDHEEAREILRLWNTLENVFAVPFGADASPPLTPKTIPNNKLPPKPETVTHQEPGGDCVSRLVRQSSANVVMKAPHGLYAEHWDIHCVCVDRKTAKIECDYRNARARQNSYFVKRVPFLPNEKSPSVDEKEKAND
jgi:hypothetical protein